MCMICKKQDIVSCESRLSKDHGMGNEDVVRLSIPSYHPAVEEKQHIN